MSEQRTNKRAVFKARDKSHLECKLFLDESGGVDVVRDEVTNYPIFKKQAERMDSFIWKPTEINLQKDKVDFNERLEPHEQFIFTQTLLGNTAMDSLAGRGLAECLLPIVSNSVVEACIFSITYFENRIHAKSYRHIIESMYNDPSKVIDSIRETKAVLSKVKSITRYYDDLIDFTQKYQQGLTHDLYTLKRKLYLFLHALNAMEGIRFYGNFASNFAFAESGRLIGNASILKLIANDEAIHVAFSTALIVRLPADDDVYYRIAEETLEECTGIYMQAVAQEWDWIEYLFQHGSMMGLNASILKSYVSERAYRCMKAVGLGPQYTGEIPLVASLPWMKSYLNEENSQPAPQETEMTSYIKGADVDVTETTFSDFEL